jgi:very-short-patch-repair endonuclease
MPKRLIIELDGYFHTGLLRIERDEARTQWLRQQGYRVLRFQNAAVWADIEAVLDTIRKVASP